MIDFIYSAFMVATGFIGAAWIISTALNISDLIERVEKLEGKQ